MLIDKQVIAHRGASGYAPENTFAAFNKAEAMGLKWVEFDVMLSQDGEAFVFHDDALERTTNGRGKFGHALAAYIKTLDAGSWFSKAFAHEKVPLLKDVLLWCSERNMNANIEIKPFPGCTQETTLAVLSQLNLYWPNNKGRLLISSFDIDALRLCRQLAPELPLSLLLNQWLDDSVQCAEELGCVSVHLHKKIVTAQRIHRLKKAHFMVCVYTVNRRREALQYLKLGVDALFSNYPDLFEKSIRCKLFKKFLDKKNCVA